MFARANPSPRTSSLPFRTGKALGLAFCVVLFLPACTNNLLQSASNLASSVTGGNPLAGVGSGSSNTSGMVLSSVQLDTFSPTSTLDLLGDGSGAMGTNCQPKAGAGAGGGGATTCTCSYTFVQSNGVQIGPVDVDTTYHESNMLRCLYTAVPAGVSYVSIYIHLTNSDTKSNTVVLNLGTNSAGGLDLSNPLNFAKASRYQCRDIVFVPYLWDGANIYDPFVSEDPKYSYPLNFYTTNMGLTFSQYTNDANSVGWNCPSLPNDTAAGMDLTLYSVATDASGNKSIFPPGGAFDRSTFYVANGQAGVFNIPVNAYVYPGMVSAATAPTGGKGGAAAGAGGGAQPPPLGYAASPIPLAGGGETCPDSSVIIPPSYHWAKLWLFRRQLPQRTFPVSNSLASFGSQGIACNSPPWTATPKPAAPKDTYFTDCSGQPSWSALNSSHLAARFSLATGACFNIGPGATTRPSTLTNYDGTTTPLHPNASYSSIDFSSFAPGTDIWVPTPYTLSDTVAGCVNGGDLSRACQAATGNVPFDSGNSLGLGYIDPSTAVSRFDYLFVVSPPSVNRQDMLSTNSSTTHSIYTPVRFMSPSDCKSTDPDMPTFPGDCSPTRMLTYGLTVSQAGAGGQVGINDPNEPGSFPMCVLQPD